MRGGVEGEVPTAPGSVDFRSRHLIASLPGIVITILSERGQAEVDAATSSEDLWLSAVHLDVATGWTFKPEGFCRGDVCVPVPAARASSFVDGDRVNVAALWRHLGQPVVHSDDTKHWYLGEGAAERGHQLASLDAPDFTLPDLDARLHSLSDHRGKKAFLATWASW